MFKLINRNLTFQWIIFVALIAFSIFQIVTSSKPSISTGTPFLFQWFNSFFIENLFAGKGIVIAILIFQIIFIQYYFNKNDFAAKTNLLPATLFLSLLLLTKTLLNITPLFFTLLFLPIIFSINYTTPSTKIKNNVFWSGIVIAIATCFDASSIILLIFVISALIINQFSRIKEFGILLFSFFLVHFYFFSYFLLTNQLQTWIQTFLDLKFLGIFTPTSFSVFKIIALIVLGIVYLLFLLRSKLISENKVIAQRNRILTLNAWAILIVGFLFISPLSMPMILGYFFIPISIFLALFSQERNQYLINEVLTALTFFALWL